MKALVVADGGGESCKCGMGEKEETLVVAMG